MARASPRHARTTRRKKTVRAVVPRPQRRDRSTLVSLIAVTRSATDCGTEVTMPSSRSSEGDTATTARALAAKNLGVEMSMLPIEADDARPTTREDGARIRPGASLPHEENLQRA